MYLKHLSIGDQTFRKITDGIFYRVRQFWQAVNIEKLPQTAVLQINTQLTSAEQEFFYLLPISDQWHSYRVMKTVQSKTDEPVMLTAALLHDVGKAKSPLSVWDRSFIVMIEQLMPKRAAGWGDGGEGWKRPFTVKTHHPNWGAEMAVKANSETAVIELIRRHQSPPAANDLQLHLLQWADNQN